MNFASRLYQRLAKAFPHEFKLAYGVELLQSGDAAIQDIAGRHGITGLVRLDRGHLGSRSDRVLE